MQKPQTIPRDIRRSTERTTTPASPRAEIQPPSPRLVPKTANPTARTSAPRLRRGNGSAVAHRLRPQKRVPAARLQPVYPGFQQCRGHDGLHNRSAPKANHWSSVQSNMSGALASGNSEVRRMQWLAVGCLHARLRTLQGSKWREVRSARTPYPSPARAAVTAWANVLSVRAFVRTGSAEEERALSLEMEALVGQLANARGSCFARSGSICRATSSGGMMRINPSP